MRCCGRGCGPAATGGCGTAPGVLIPMGREGEKGWDAQAVRKVTQKISPVLQEGFWWQSGSGAHRAKRLSCCWVLGIVKAGG